MSDAQRVIDEIDALIEEQLRGGEPETGYDFDDPDFPECRCGLDWHGLPAYGCPGSDTEGPLRSAGLTFGRPPAQGLGQFMAENLLRDTGPNTNGPVEYYESTPLYSSETSLDSASLPSHTPDYTAGDLALLGEIHQWPRLAVEEAWGVLAQAARQMWQQFAESWSRLESLRLSELRPLGLRISVEPERFDLGQWVAEQDWEAEIRETTPSFAAQVQELATQPLPPPTPMWAVDVTRSRRGRQ